MGDLQKDFEDALAKLNTHENIFKFVVRSAMKKKGVDLSDDDASAIYETWQQNPNIPLTIGALPSGTHGNIAFDITDNELQIALRDYDRILKNAIDKTIKQIPKELAPDRFQDLNILQKQHLSKHQTTLNILSRDIARIWGDGFDMLQLLILFVEDACETIRQEIWNGEREPAAKDIALYGLSIRATRIASEVLILMKSGYADGAFARWRSLHELGVTAMFLCDNNNNIALQYLDHSIVARYKGYRRYSEQYEQLGFAPISDIDKDLMEQEYEDILTKYGKDFRYDYGWASDVVGAKKPNFIDIEKHIDLSHWRPYFGLASNSVHAGSHSLLFSMGSPAHDGAHTNYAASAYGMCDPGQCTLLSLRFAIIPLLTHRSSIDSLVACEVINLIIDAGVARFYKSHELLEQLDVTQEDDIDFPGSNKFHKQRKQYLRRRFLGAIGRQSNWNSK